MYLVNKFVDYYDQLDANGEVGLRDSEETDNYSVLPIFSVFRKTGVEFVINTEGELQKIILSLKKIPYLGDANEFVRSGTNAPPYILYDSFKYLAEEKIKHRLQAFESWSEIEPLPESVTAIKCFYEKYFIEPDDKAIQQFETVIAQLIKTEQLQNDEKLFPDFPLQSEKGSFNDKVTNWFTEVMSKTKEKNLNYRINVEHRTEVWRCEDTYQSFATYKKNLFTQSDGTVSALTGKKIQYLAKKSITNIEKSKLFSTTNFVDKHTKGNFREQLYQFDAVEEMKFAAILDWLQENRSFIKTNDGGILGWRDDLSTKEDNEFTYFQNAINGKRQVMSDEVTLSGFNVLFYSIPDNGRMFVTNHLYIDGSKFHGTVTDWQRKTLWVNKRNEAVSFFERGHKAVLDLVFAKKGVLVNSSEQKKRARFANELIKHKLENRAIPTLLVKELEQNILDNAAKKKPSTDKQSYDEQLWLYCAIINKNDYEGEYELNFTLQNRSRDFLFGALLANAHSFEQSVAYAREKKGNVKEEDEVESSVKVTFAHKRMKMMKNRPIDTWLTIYERLIRVYKKEKSLHFFEANVAEILAHMPDDGFSNVPLKQEYLLGYSLQLHDIKLKRSRNKQEKNATVQEPQANDDLHSDVLLED
ncbi:type I-C CRISPR-associated protein Cas8c/Csd1 [Caryophanon latum]|uniref:Type I-C CRISPR-associated protein Cas8c/Csd1 n=1 Tax=Caryophanon latum TaxID=33977 RepID=A0A1C0YV07_9BACL|nr:type I-C CRISPR-associated protein Cas8c/Csd1 [Caryophanon latum]OCS90992.1 hypothetical protein A6K76_10500 [Caryophanon latum]